MPCARQLPSIYWAAPFPKNNQERLIHQAPIRQNLTFEQKLDVIDYYHRFEGHLTLEAMVPVLRNAGYSTICATTIRRCVNDEEKIRRLVSEDPSRLHSKRELMVAHPQVENALKHWVSDELSRSTKIRRDLVIKKAHELCDIMGIPPEGRIVFSKGWFQSFKRRHQIPEHVHKRL